MQETYHTNPTDLVATLGPCISQKNYDVGEELYDIFYEACFPVQQLFIRDSSTSTWYFDLRAADVPNQRIEVSDICTYEESDTYFSARKLGIRSGGIASCLHRNFSVRVTS